MNDLKKLADKQVEWRELPARVKLSYINKILDSIEHSAGSEAFLDMANANMDMMGLPRDSPEGAAQAAEFAFFSCLCIKQTLFGFKQAYEVRTGQSKYSDQLKSPFIRKAINGQLVAQILPGDPASTLNPFAPNNTGEIWFDKDAVKNVKDVDPFNFDFCDKKADGVLVVLGAGTFAYFISMRQCNLD